MKKLALLLLFTAIVAVGCKTQSSAIKKDSEKISFEYEALTRGKYNKIIVKQDTVITIKDREMKDVVTRSLPKSDWNSLLESVGKVNLDKLSTLEAPSKKHQFDGAPLANLKVIRGDKTYQTVTFDHGNPPAEIKEVVTKLLSVSDLNKKK